MQIYMFLLLFYICVTTLALLFVISLKIWAKLTAGRCRSKVCLIGKVALVTGGSSGIGYQTVLDLLSRGCRVIVADKIVDEDIKQTMMKETNNPEISFEYVDMGSLNSVRQLVDKVRRTGGKLDILMNIAGIMKTTDISTEKGISTVMQVNYFGGFCYTFADRFIEKISIQSYNLHQLSPSQ
ncbi:hypothetical protein JTB14_032840 [Gonioctena quinquepunctata]|nr:hypothetical protein JTB14_032840 [Gonioctena quinquepunctata]